MWMVVVWCTTLKTPSNVVELNNCRDHQSYYTCLSQSVTAEGTIILQGFDSTKITGGAHSTLQQEFRELEILDLLCKMRYEGTLPDHIDGHWCNTLIRQFQLWKGSSFVPQDVHPAIKWSMSNPFFVNETRDACSTLQLAEWLTDWFHLMRLVMCRPGLGWALAGLGFRKLKPGPELRARLGLGLVGLKPGLIPKW